MNLNCLWLKKEYKKENITVQSINGVKYYCMCANYNNIDNCSFWTVMEFKQWFQFASYANDNKLPSIIITTSRITCE